MNSLGQFALMLISKNPNIANNPNAQEMIDVIRRGDSVRGEQIANNLCQSFGVSKDDALKDARAFFNF